ncbi:MAG: serine--tRNA ligase [archaeon]
MLDIKLFRENPDVIRENLRRRKDDEKLKWIDEVIKNDQKAKKIKSELDSLRSSRNSLSQQINKLKKEGKSVKKVLIEVKTVPARIRTLEVGYAKLQEKIIKRLLSFPNIMHESVPYGRDDSENVEVKAYGKKPNFTFKLKSHVEVGENLGVLDFDESAKIAGAGFYYLKSDLALLNQALINFARDKMVKKGFVYMEPPLMMRRKSYEGVTDVEDFENVMYKIEDEDLYMIATSEHPLVAYYMNSFVKPEDLPIKLVGYSICFRKEIGSRGIDTKGIWRTHQFNKVEMVIICNPEESWNLHEEMKKISEEVLKDLKLPFRVVNICTGDLGIVAAKKYDMEVWRPRLEKYGEVMSCSNCTDYQARRLGIKIVDKQGNKVIAHTLNNTVLATSRILVAIMENYQQKDGTIKVPAVLVPYMNGKNFIGK